VSLTAPALAGAHVTGATATWGLAWPGLAAAGLLAAVTALLSCAVPRPWRARVSGAGTALTGLAGTVAGVGAVTGHRSPVLSVPGVLPLSMSVPSSA